MDTDSETNTIDTTAAPEVVPTKPAKAKKAAPARKPKAKSAERQRGRTELAFDEMTAHEQALLRALYTPSGPRVAKAIHELQDQLWPKKKKATGTSLVRNTLRRLVKFGWVELATPTKAEVAAHKKAKSGRLYSKYLVTEKGRKRGIKD